MTPTNFRELALALPGAEEGAHGGHADFRLGGKVFASLGHPDAGHAMVKLTPEQQAECLSDEPEIFAPAAGAWGQRGYTMVRLSAARVGIVRPAIRAAWENMQSRRRNQAVRGD